MTKIQWIGVCCICLGIGTSVLPFAKEQLEDNKRQTLLRVWKEEQHTWVAQEKEYIEEESIHTNTDVIGILSIPVIDLETPILKDASTEHLNISISTIEPTAALGEIGNFVLAGHNSRTYGKHFNRLEELEYGDTICIASCTEDYVYKVSEKYIVAANETWVLDSTSEEAEITLITCAYMENGEKKRLVVKGKLSKERESE